AAKTDPGSARPKSLVGSALVLTMGAHTDRGRVRESNEDSHSCDQAAGVAVVADGMGGHAAGEIASGMAAQAVGRELAAARGDIAGLDPAGYETAAQENGQIISSGKAALLRRAAHQADKRGTGAPIEAGLWLARCAH